MIINVGEPLSSLNMDNFFVRIYINNDDDDDWTYQKIGVKLLKLRILLLCNNTKNIFNATTQWRLPFPFLCNTQYESSSM